MARSLFPCEPCFSHLRMRNEVGGFPTVWPGALGFWAALEGVSLGPTPASSIATLDFLSLLDINNFDQSSYIAFPSKASFIKRAPLKQNQFKNC